MTVEPCVAVLPADGSVWITSAFFDRVGVDGFDRGFEARRFQLFGRLFAREAGGRRHLAAARAGADGQGHLRLRAEEGEEGAVELGLVPGGERGSCSSTVFAAASRSTRVDSRRPRSRCCSSRCGRGARLVAGHVRDSVLVSRVSARPSRTPITTAATAAAIQRRGGACASLLLGIAPRPRPGSRPPAAAPRRRPCPPPARRARSSPRRGRR